ncbi:MAG: cupin domain-containing protein [Anaerolineae bacterium]
MHIERGSFEATKGWYIGPWNTSVSISVGYANEGLDEPHYHEEITEIYMVARGTVEMRIEQETVKLGPNDVVVVEPGEAHTFLSASPDHFHFVVHTPGVAGSVAKKDKVKVKRSRLGL